MAPKFTSFVPHFLFFSSAALLSKFGQKFLEPLSSPVIHLFFILIYPLIKSFMIWKSPSASTTSQEDLVVLWTALGSYYAVSGLFFLIPFSSMIFKQIPSISELTLP
jgi:hypothetical protein